MNIARAITFPCLIIAACYVPLIWYMAELHAHYSGGLYFSDLSLFDQVLVVVFTVAPPWCLSVLKINWKPEQPIN